MSKDMEFTKESLRLLVNLLVGHQDRLIIETTQGIKYDFVGARVIGSGTDDPGVVLKIRNQDRSLRIVNDGRGSDVDA